MTERTRSRAALARWWAALLALCIFLAPLDGLAERSQGKTQPTAAQAKKHGTTTKKRTVKARKHTAKSGKHVVKKRSVARKHVAVKKSRSSKHASRKHAVRHVAARPVPIPADPGKLPLKASVAYVIDQESDEVLFRRNARDVRPIA